MSNKKLFQNISFFTFFNVLNSAIPFLLLPILTVYLSPADYGKVDIFLNISMVATPIIGLSVAQSISRYYFEKIDMSRFVTTVFIILMASGIIFISLSILTSLLLTDLLLSFDVPPLLVILAFVHAFLSQIIEILLIIWRVSYETVKFGVFRVAKTVLDLGLSIILIVTFGLGWEGRVGPQVAAVILFATIAVIYLRKMKYLEGLKIDPEYRKSAMSFSTPLIFHTLGGNLIGFSDRFFILFMLDVSKVGIYSVGYQIGMVVGLFQNSFNQAWVPFFFEKLKEDKKSDKYKIVKITYIYFILMLLLAAAIYWITPWVYRNFIGHGFETGFNVVLWILLGYAFNGMYKMVVNYLFYLKKTSLIAYSTLGAAFVNLVLNYYMIQSNGIEGAAQASAITFLLLFLIIFAISAKKYSMPWLLDKE